MAEQLKPVFETLKNIGRVPNPGYSTKDDNFEVWTPMPIKVNVVEETKEIFPPDLDPPTEFANAHSCSYCAKLIIDTRVDESYREPRKRKYAWYFQNTEYGITEIYDASVNGCLFFKTLFAHGGVHVVDPRQRNLATIENPLERFIAKWGQGRLSLSIDTAKDDFDNVKRIRVRWMHRSVKGVDERYSCRVPKPYPAAWNVCALEGTEAAQWVKYRPVNQDLGSPASLEVARQCLEECHSTHESCGRDQSVVPSRLIEITLDGQLKLVNTNGKLFDYCALSYCWGGDQPYKTTADKLEAYKEGVTVPATAKTIHDAITVTKGLGLRHIWIDALAIVQDDEADKVRELSRMPGIYKGAFVTLIASSASSSTEGFLQERKSNSSVFKLPFKCPDGEMSFIYLHQAPRKYDAGDPILNRAWCLQESMLSPRTLKFSRDRLFWNCHTPLQTMSESGWRGLTKLDPPSSDTSILGGNGTKVSSSATASSTKEYIVSRMSNAWPPKDIDDAMREWTRIVEQYSQRRLTVSSDKLVALAGIADEFAQNVRRHCPEKSAQYAAGLWHFDLARQLLWKHQTWFSQQLSPRPTAYRAPTWSWASIDDPLQFMDQCHPIIEVLGDQVNHKNAELLYGEVTFALLAVVGRIKQARLTKGGTRIQDPHMPGFEDLEIASVDLDALDQGKHSISNMSVWLLEAAIGPWNRTVGLVLAPAQLPDQSAFGGPLALVGGGSTDNEPLNAFNSAYWDVESEALVHLRRRPTPPPPPLEDEDWDSSARQEMPYNGYYFRRMGFFEMLVDFRERAEGPMDGEQPSFFEQEQDPKVEHLSWFDDCRKRAVLLV